MDIIKLTRNSRTGGNNLEAVQKSLSLVGIKCELKYNAEQCGYGVNDILIVEKNEILTPEQWRLIEKGYDISI